jgi:hypothetical protein
MIVYRLVGHGRRFGDDEGILLERVITVPGIRSKAAWLEIFLSDD